MELCAPGRTTATNIMGKKRSPSTMARRRPSRGSWGGKSELGRSGTGSRGQGARALDPSQGRNEQRGGEGAPRLGDTGNARPGNSTALTAMDAGKGAPRAESRARHQGDPTDTGEGEQGGGIARRAHQEARRRREQGAPGQDAAQGIACGKNRAVARAQRPREQARREKRRGGWVRHGSRSVSRESGGIGCWKN